MSYIVKGYQCNRAFEIFEDICAIPHGSGNESGVADYIEIFASRLGLECKRDALGNVFLKKDACRGYENVPAVLLQGHMDMVCEKNADVDHDFERDALDLFVDGDLLGARGTSLGGDNGIAVAMMLALLETNSHPALECLFTVEEETGLGGAMGFDCSQITAKRMINLDSEEENTVTVGCAGGVRTDVEFNFTQVDLQTERETVEIKISGLAGGHSGADINTGRASALVLLGRILQRVLSEQKVWLVSVSGGGKDNAIAREGNAVLLCENPETLISIVKDEESNIRKELCSLDSGFAVSFGVGTASRCFRLKDTKKIISFMILVKTGVLKLSNQIEGLVEYSRNLGIVETNGERIIFYLSARSSLESQIDLACRELDMLASALGAKTKHYSRYPGWEYAPDSKLREDYLDTFESLCGTRPEVVVIHAGLECGVISSRTQGLDIISIGPNMYDIHSPAERLSLSSCEKIWMVIVEFLAKK